jgi:RNA polymerase sigma-70 factor (ECF subfamily)
VIDKVSSTSEAAPQPAVPVTTPDDITDFAGVVNAHWSAVYRLLHTLTGNLHDTEDLTQETFLRALRRRDSYQAGTRLRAWLLRIASNAFFDLRRKRQRSRTEPLASDPPGRASHPERRLETVEQSALLQAALQDLTELTRLVFHLRAQEDLSFREIAELAGTTEQAARWHMHQARSRLLQQLGDER